MEPMTLAAVAQEAPAALVVRLEEELNISSGGATWTAAVGARLTAGDELIPAAASRAHLAHRSRQTQVVSEPTTIAASASDSEQELEWSIEAISCMGLDPAGDGRLLAAVVFTDLGIYYYEAARALAEMEESGERLGADLLLLKGEVLDRLGRLEEAR